jgi:membrane-associated phospholipid phosphatase
VTLSAGDRWLAGCLLAALATAAVLSAVNAYWFGFTGIGYFPREAWWIAFAALDLVFFGLWARARAPYASFVAINLAFYALTAAVMGVLTTAIQYTPFPRVDPALARWDAALGWDTVAVLRWVSARSGVRTLLVYAYNSTELQLVLAPLIAALAHDRRRLRVFLYAVVYSSIAGSLVYYFFPSSGPAGIFDSPDFVPVQRLTQLKFEQVHTFKPVTTLLGGLIAFPSFHVAWSVLATYAARTRPGIFWALAALNVVVLASTALLGWHYLVDVFAGLVLALSCIAAGAETYRRCDGDLTKS